MTRLLIAALMLCALPAWAATPTPAQEKDKPAATAPQTAEEVREDAAEDVLPPPEDNAGEENANDHETQGEEE